MVLFFFPLFPPDSHPWGNVVRTLSLCLRIYIFLTCVSCPERTNTDQTLAQICADDIMWPSGPGWGPESSLSEPHFFFDCLYIRPDAVSCCVCACAPSHTFADQEILGRNKNKTGKPDHKHLKKTKTHNHQDSIPVNSNKGLTVRTKRFDINKPLFFFFFSPSFSEAEHLAQRGQAS